MKTHIPAYKTNENEQLFDPKKLQLSFDAYRSYDSVDEAIDYLNAQPNPTTAFLATIIANSLLGEFGFVSELAAEGDQIKADN